MSIEEVRSFLEKHWYSNVGIVVAEISIFVVLTPILSSFDISGWLTVALISIALIAVFCFWVLSIQPPKTPKNKVGFLISIACSDAEDERKVKEDLVVPLMQLVKSGKAGNTFHFMQLPQHLAEQVLDPDIAQTTRLKSGAHFMLFGRVRKRQLEDGKMYHFFDFEGVVAHQPVSDEISKKLSVEFAELLPRKVQISSENDLFSFQFTSEWADVVARYIIGIAAACSGDISYADQLFDDAKDRLASKNKSFPVYAKLMERLPLRKAELYEAMASSIHKEWASSHNPELVPQINLWLDKIEDKYQSRPMVLTLRAISIFLASRDANSAIEIIKKIDDHESPSWHCNMAFLFGYVGDLKHSIQRYRAAAKLAIDIDAFNQIEDFINWILQEESDKYHLHYILGFFNWQIRGDNIQAINNFKNFLMRCDRNKFLQEQALAVTWITTITKTCSIEDIDAINKNKLAKGVSLS